MDRNPARRELVQQLHDGNDGEMVPHLAAARRRRTGISITAGKLSENSWTAAETVMASCSTAAFSLRSTFRQPRAAWEETSRGINDAGQISGRYCAITGC